MIQAFISEAKAYCEARGIQPATLGLYAVADSKLFARLEGGGQCMPKTMDRVRAYMAEHPAELDSVPVGRSQSRDQEASR